MNGRGPNLLSYLVPVLATLVALGAAIAIGLNHFRQSRGSSKATSSSDSFTLYVSRPSGVRPLGDRCQPGDVLRARFESENPFVLILQRTPSGQVRAVYPADASKSLKLETSSGITSNSWMLDGEEGTERFYAFFSKSALDVDAARTAVARSEDTPTLDGAVVLGRSCVKEKPR
jgi:hypothetical protein